MGGWGCPHEIGGTCMRIKGFDCDPGMKGCVLFGRFHFSNDAKNRPGKVRGANDFRPPASPTASPPDHHEPEATKPPRSPSR